MFRFSFSDLEIAGNYLTEYVAHFGYYDLFRQLITHHSEDPADNVALFIKALYPQITNINNINPSASFCSNLAAFSWRWNTNHLG